MKKNIRYVFIFLVTFAVYYLFSFGRSAITGSNRYVPHDVFNPMASSLLKGRVDIEKIDPDTLELVRYKGKLYFCNGPGPVLLVTPYTLISKILGHEVNLREFASILTAMSMVLVWIILEKQRLGKTDKVLLLILYAFGTMYFHLTVVASSWFFTHLAAAFFMLASLCFILDKIYIPASLFLGLAITCRPSMMVGTVAYATYLFFLYRKGAVNGKRVLLSGLVMAVALSLIPIYNYLRFGSIWETMYSAMDSTFWPGQREFSIAYIPHNLYYLLVKSFDYVDHFPYLYASEEGQSVLFTTPAMFFLLRAKLNNLNKMLLGYSGLILIPVMLFITNGLTHFGYRYTVDAYPFLLLPLASGFRNTKSMYGKMSLVALSVVFTFIGVWQWNGNLF